MPLCQARTARNSMRNGCLPHQSLLLLHLLLQLLQVITLQQSASGAALEVALLPQALPGLGGSTASPQTPGPAHSALSAARPQSQTQRVLRSITAATDVLQDSNGLVSFANQGSTSQRTNRGSYPYNISAHVPYNMYYRPAMQTNDTCLLA